jgi:hypothetical protein
MAESDLTLDTLNALLFDWFPILGTREYVELVGDVEDQGPYTVFGIIFSRYIEDMVISGVPEDRAKIAGFLENMAKAKDQGVVVLLRIEILPILWKTQRTIDTYWEYFGVETRRVLIWLAPKHAPRITLPSPLDRN